MTSEFIKAVETASEVVRDESRDSTNVHSKIRVFEKLNRLSPQRSLRKPKVKRLKDQGYQPLINKFFFSSGKPNEKKRHRVRTNVLNMSDLGTPSPSPRKVALGKQSPRTPKLKTIRPGTRSKTTLARTSSPRRGPLFTAGGKLIKGGEKGRKGPGVTLDR